MELKDFIKDTITDITDAVCELQAHLQNGAVVSPSYPNRIANATIIDPNNHKSNMLISKVNFDVAITAGSNDSTNGGGKIGIHVLSVGMEGNSEQHKENVSKITFSIPIAFPSAYVPTPEDIARNKAPKRQVPSLS